MLRKIGIWLFVSKVLKMFLIWILLEVENYVVFVYFMYYVNWKKIGNFEKKSLWGF